MRRVATALTAAVLLVFGVSACGGTADDSGSAKSGGAPVAKGGKLEPADITLWVGFTQRELGVIKDTVKEFEKANPQVSVKVVGGINDDKIIAAARGGKAPGVRPEALQLASEGLDAGVEVVEELGGERIVA